MRNALIFLIMLTFLFSPSAFCAEKNKETITISGAWAMYPTVVAWAQEFKKLYPQVTIEISAGGAGKGAADVIAGLVDIGMVSRDPDPAEINKGVTPIYVLHDAVYLVISDKNPVAEQLIKHGVKRQAIIDIYLNGIIKTWGEVAGTMVDKPLHIYTRSDACGAAAALAKYLGKKQEDLKGVGVYSDPAILQTVAHDNTGIGYSNFGYVFDEQGRLIPGIRLVPIDADENGVVDSDEMYTNRQQAIEAIQNTAYPVARKNYFFVKGAPAGIIKEFIAFSLSQQGTEIVEKAGTSIPLSAVEREEVLKTLEQNK